MVVHMFTCIQKCGYPTFTSFLLGIFLEINHPAIIRGSPMTFCGPHMGLSARFRGFAQVKVHWTKNCPLRPDWTATWGQAVGLLARDSRHIFLGKPGETAHIDDVVLDVNHDWLLQSLVM